MQGDATASPFRRLLTETPIGRGTKALNPGGAGAKPPPAAPAPKLLLMYGRSLIMHRQASKWRNPVQNDSFRHLSVRTKPQAPRSLRCWLTSSFVAGVVCESQEVTHCDSSSQNDARRARASQLLCRHDAALSAFRRTVRTTLRQVAGPARSG